MKHIETFKNADSMVKVEWSKTWEEYRVRLFQVKGMTLKAQKPADYFTDDKLDAIRTARAMLVNRNQAPLKLTVSLQVTI